MAVPWAQCSLGVDRMGQQSAEDRHRLGVHRRLRGRMMNRWTNAAGQWVRWLMGESKFPGRGQRAVAIPIILVAVLAIAGVSAAMTPAATSTAPVVSAVESDPPTPPPGSLDPITAATADTSSSSASSDSTATSTTLPPTPTPAKPVRVRTPRVKTTPAAGATRVPNAGRHAKGAAAPTPTTTTPAPPTTTTTTTAPDTGGWA